jgi:FkbM family methyltransferase
LIVSKKYNRVFIATLMFLGLCTYIFKTNFPNMELSSFSIYSMEYEKPVVSLWDFSKPLNMSDSIECVKSKAILDKSTMLCIHSKTDLISASFLQWGEFEGHLVNIFLKYLIDNPDWLVIDVGANLGLYTLYGASTGTKVLAVEPFYDNQIRLNKAAILSGTSDRITLITNALSNKRNQIAKLIKNDANVGGQGLIPNEAFSMEKKKSASIDESKYYVHTILFDDIVEYIPLNKNNVKFKKSILKIDIEAYEPYAFQHATRLFSQINICIIIMEWMNIGRNDNLIKERDEMLDFLYSRNYTAFTPQDAVINRENYPNWPTDIIWKRKDC